MPGEISTKSSICTHGGLRYMGVAAESKSGKGGMRQLGKSDILGAENSLLETELNYLLKYWKRSKDSSIVLTNIVNLYKELRERTKHGHFELRLTEGQQKRLNGCLRIAKVKEAIPVVRVPDVSNAWTMDMIRSELLITMLLVGSEYPLPCREPYDSLVTKRDPHQYDRGR